MKKFNNNILYFTRTMELGGTEKVILQLCNNLRDQFDNIIVCSSGGVYEEELKELGIKHYKIEDIEKKSIINIIKTIKVLIRIIRREKINIIHTHHRMAAFYTSLLHRIFNFSFVHTSHNTFKDKKKLTQIALRNAKIICVGEKVKENIISFYSIEGSNVEVVYNGISEYKGETNPLEIISKYKENGYFIVGNIGRLSEQKGMEYFIKAAPKVINKEKIVFFIIGEGQEKQNLKDLALELGVEDKVIFLGYRNDIPNIIRQLDLIVLSSLWEGLPLTPIEVFSQKKTIIATNVDGTPEIVIDNYNGILVRKENSKEIAGKILMLFKDKELKHKLELNAYKTYIDKFTEEKFISGYYNVYLNLLLSRGKNERNIISSI